MSEPASATLIIPVNEDPDEVLRRSDMAMYQSKRLGGNRCWFAEDEPAARALAA